MRLDTRYAATTVALVLMGVAYSLGQAWLERPAPPRPSRVTAERRAPAPPPTADNLLERAAALGLTAEQRARLAVLQAAWVREAGALGGAAAAARGEFERVTRETGPRGVSLAEIQRQSAEYRELSAAWREARQRHVEAARAVLTETQRERLAHAAIMNGQQGGTR